MVVLLVLPAIVFSLTPIVYEGQGSKRTGTFSIQPEAEMWVMLAEIRLDHTKLEKFGLEEQEAGRSQHVRQVFTDRSRQILELALIDQG